jgi:formate hydrogenlyase subunit 4
MTVTLVHLALALTLAPLLGGLIARVKALVGGRRGQPLLQGYFDLFKLLRKGAVYSRTTSWLFRAGPIVSLACIAAALLLVPVGAQPAPLAVAADFVLLATLLGLGRFFLVSAALDTGSSFEGMGGSRETHFAALSEPVLFLGLGALARHTQALSLSHMTARTSPLAPEVLLVAASLFIVLLCENSRVPFDDPNTHLELTMVHEVMVLDHSGPDLAFILYGAALKLWLWAAILVNLLLPFALKGTVAVWAVLGGVILVALGIGVVESTVARLRLNRVPSLLATALVLVAVAFLLGVRS